MRKLNTMLVVIDPTIDRDFVIERAILIAGASSAKVELFINNENTLNAHSYMYEGIDPEFIHTQNKLYANHHKQLLDKIAADFSKAKIEVTTCFKEDHNLAEAIIDHVKTSKPDLVVKSTHHHSPLKRSIISNTDWRLIRKCPVPLLLVKPIEWRSAGAVVTAVDPMHAKSEQSTLDSLLLETTEFIAQALQQTPHVFHSYFPFVSTLFSSGASVTAGLDRIRATHKEKLDALLEGHNIDPANIKLSQGELVPKLIDYVQSVHSNMLIIGSLSRNVLERAIVGDTAQRILEDCPCDVLVMKARQLS